MRVTSAETAAGPRRPTPRWVLALILAVCCAGAVEGACWLALWRREGEAPSPARWRAERQRAAADGPATPLGLPRRARTERGRARNNVILHPYLGYTTERRALWGRRFQVDDFGFVQTPANSAALDTGDFHVAVLGGSVAQMFALGAGDELAAELAGAPGTEDRRVRVIDLAMGGYKQPQQLMTLVWSLAAGRQIDAVVLLDGFNDVVLPRAENFGAGVHPFYPRGWRALTDGAADPARLLAAGELASVSARRAGASTWCSRRPLSWSAACELFWGALDRRLERRAMVLAARLERGSGAPPPGALGPPGRPAAEADWLREAADLWGRSAVLTRQLCDERGIPFRHFLQPNQYVEGSKPMGAAERSVALRPEGSYGTIARLGYPELRRVGAALAAAGEPFEDLTLIFRQVEEPVYVDDCCHLNERGNRLLAARVARSLRRELSASLGTSESMR